MILLMVNELDCVRDSCLPLKLIKVGANDSCFIFVFVNLSVFKLMSVLIPVAIPATAGCKRLNHNFKKMWLC
jgi:hypothetical protein